MIMLHAGLARCNFFRNTVKRMISMTNLRYSTLNLPVKMRSIAAHGR